MRVTSGKSQVRESRLPGSVRAKPNGRATRPQFRESGNKEPHHRAHGHALADGNDRACQLFVHGSVGYRTAIGDYRF